MSSVYIGKNLRKFESVPQFSGYTRVVLQVSNDIEYSAGTDTGRTLTLVNPWGTPQIAEAILAQVRGFAYQPYSASGAIVDAAAELGDAVSVNGIYSGVYNLVRRYGGIQLADLSAPSDEEIDHEYPYKSPQDRTVTRQFREVRASLLIQADRIAAEVEDRKAEDNLLRATLNVQAQEIEAKVSKEGGDASSFGWKLTASGWSVYGNGSEIFGVDKSGAYVKGEIRATAGKIGNWDINWNYLSYNGQTWGGTNTSGAYIGQSGIQLGKYFMVDMQGNLKAARGTFGSISVNSNGNTVGTYSGSLSGCGGSVSGISGSVSGITGSLSTGIRVGGKNIATYVGDIVAGKITAEYINAKLGSVKKISIGNYDGGWSMIYYKDHDGNDRSLRVLVGQ